MKGITKVQSLLCLHLPGYTLSESNINQAEVMTALLTLPYKSLHFDYYTVKLKPLVNLNFLWH